MIIESPKFKNGESIPVLYTCDGDGINPPLNFSGVPAEAKSLALIVEDPDSPNGTFEHWLLWNLLPTAEIFENSTPTEAEVGLNGGGEISYYPPCPHKGEHRYYFKLYALDDMIDLQSGADKDELEASMSGHVLEKAELMGLYRRQIND